MYFCLWAAHKFGNTWTGQLSGVVNYALVQELGAGGGVGSPPSPLDEVCTCLVFLSIPLGSGHQTLYPQ